MKEFETCSEIDISLKDFIEPISLRNDDDKGWVFNANTCEMQLTSSELKSIAAILDSLNKK